MSRPFPIMIVLTLAIAATSGCAPSTMGQPPISGLSGGTRILTQKDTINLENSDRIRRFQRLAHLEGLPPPLIEQDYAPAGLVHNLPGKIPVVRVVFNEKVFFNTDSAIPLPQAMPVIDLIARNMKEDVPDAVLTILGHTDSRGSDAYNMALSERRALHVMRLLAERGVDPLQMTTVAVGERQPIATNSTPEGRARNRRVEFLISANAQANFAVIQHRHVDPDFLRDAPASVRSDPRPTLKVYQGRNVSIKGQSKVALVPVGNMQVEGASERTTTERDLAPPPAISLRPMQKISPAQLSNIVVD